MAVQLRLFRLHFGYWLIKCGEKISGIEVTGMRG